MSVDVAIALEALVLAGSLLVHLPVGRSPARRLVVTALLVATAVTMTVSTGLLVDAGPMQMFPLTPGLEFL